MNKRNITLHVNEEKYNLTVDANQTLLQVLRDLGSTGTKYGCGTGECGACTVLVDGKTSILACLTLASLTDGMHITTIMGLEKDGWYHRLSHIPAMAREAVGWGLYKTMGWL